MKRYGFFLVAALLATTLLTGCSVYEVAKEGAKDTYNFMFDREPKSGPLYGEDDTPIIELNTDAADSLFYNISKHHELPEGSPVYVRNFVNEDDPDDKARFGRITANQVSTRLAQHDLLITDGAPKPMPVQPAPVKMDNATEDTGFFRSKQDVKPRPSMLTGTYYIGDTIIYMNAKIIRLQDNVVISSTSWTLPINDNVRELLPQLKQRDDYQNSGTRPAVRDSF